jgi:2-phosphosulfolactate phosphatase
MPTISVCLSPLLADLQNFDGKVAVVADILRATTTIVTALEFGVKSILPVESVERCRDFQQKDYIGAAERGGTVVDGFKLGNSPFDYLKPLYKGKKVVFTTTNGTKTISLVRKAERIVFGAFVNLQALAGFLYDQKKDIVIICAGWEGEVNLEDTVFAGALIDKLKSAFSIEGDPAFLALTLFLQTSGELALSLNGSSHILRLQKLNLQRDIDFCLTLDKYQIVPELVNGEIVPCTIIKSLK